MEVRAGLIKDSFEDFASFVKKKVSPNIKGLAPGGTLTPVNISGRPAIKVQHAGYGGPEGPGYFIYQGRNYYLYVITGRNDLTYEASSLINKLVSSIQVAQNQLPAVEVIVRRATSKGSGSTVKVKDEIFESEKYNFRLAYPGSCGMRDTSGDADLPVLLQLSLCGTEGKEPVKVSVYADEATEAYKEYVQGKTFYGRKKILISDTIGDMYYLGRNRVRERQILLQKGGFTYIFTLSPDKSSYDAQYFAVLSGFQFQD